MAVFSDELVDRIINKLLIENEQLKGLVEHSLDKIETYQTELAKVRGEFTNLKANSPKVGPKANSPKIGPKDLETLLFFMTGLGEGNARINVIKWIKEMFPDLMLVEAKNFTESLMDKYSVYQDRAS
jgi:ribosomal protein L7/L12